MRRFMMTGAVLGVVDAVRSLAPRRVFPWLCLMMAVGASRPLCAQPGVGPCSLRAAAEGDCEAVADPAPEPAVDPGAAVAPAKRRDSLKNGAIIGGAIGLVVGVVAAGIADCPGDDPSGSCPLPRVGAVVGATALYAGIGIGIDALVTDLTPAHTVPDSRRHERRRVAPASRPVGVRLSLSW